MNLFAGRAEGEEASGDTSSAVIIEVDVNAIVDGEYQVVYQIPDVAWKLEQETAIDGLL